MKLMKPRNLLENIKLFFELIRLRNCLIGFFGVFVTAILINPENLFQESIILAALTVFFLMGAGNMINDYFDSEIDKINKPFRPIPSGRIENENVLMLSIVFFFLGIIIAKNINFYCFLISIINSLLLVFYAKYSKKLLLVSNLGISYLVASIFIFGAFSVAGTINKEQIKILTILTASAFLMTFSREIIKDIEDMEGDKKEYSITLPIKFGVRKAKNLAIFFAIIAILFSAFPFFILSQQSWFFNLQIYGFFIAIADLLFLISLTMHPSLSQRLMVFGMLLALIGFFLGRISPIYF